MTNLLQGNYDAVHFSTEDVRKGNDGTATIDDLIAELAQEANKALRCVVETAQAPNHTHTAQHPRQNLGNVLRNKNKGQNKQIRVPGLAAPCCSLQSMP